MLVGETGSNKAAANPGTQHSIAFRVMPFSPWTFDEKGHVLHPEWLTHSHTGPCMLRVRTQAGTSLGALPHSNCLSAAERGASWLCARLCFLCFSLYLHLNFKCLPGQHTFMVMSLFNLRASDIALEIYCSSNILTYLK